MIHPSSVKIQLQLICSEKLLWVLNMFHNLLFLNFEFCFRCSVNNVTKYKVLLIWLLDLPANPVLYIIESIDHFFTPHLCYALSKMLSNIKVANGFNFFKLVDVPSFLIHINCYEFKILFMFVFLCKVGFHYLFFHLIWCRS